MSDFVYIIDLIDLIDVIDLIDLVNLIDLVELIDLSGLSDLIDVVYLIYIIPQAHAIPCASADNSVATAGGPIREQGAAYGVCRPRYSPGSKTRGRASRKDKRHICEI